MSIRRVSVALAATVLAIGVAMVQAGQEQLELKSKIRQSLESLLESQAKGVSLKPNG